jgi:hypothetical protein
MVGRKEGLFVGIAVSVGVVVGIRLVGMLLGQRDIDGRCVESSLSDGQ